MIVFWNDYWKEINAAENITRSVRALDKGAPLNPEISNEAKINAYAGHFMQEIWKQVRARIGREGGEKAESRIDDLLLDLTSVPDAELHKKFAENPSEGFAALFTSTCDLFAQLALRFEVAQSKDIDNHQRAGSHSALPFGAGHYQEYRRLLTSSDFYKQISLGFPSQHISGGFHTAQRITLGLLQRFEEFYENKATGEPSPEKLRNLIDAGRDFVSTLSKTEFGTLSAIEDEITEIVPVGQHGSAPAPRLKNIYVRVENGKHVIDIQRESLERISRSVARMIETKNFPKGRPFHSACPAGFVSPTPGKTMVEDVYDSDVELMRKFYFPLFQEKK